MNIPFEMIIIAVAAIAMLAVGIAVVVKKRNQEIDDDYQWSDEHREKISKKRIRNSNANIHTDNDTDVNANNNIICDDTLLSAASLTEEINKIKEKQIKDFESAAALEEAAFEAELEEDVYTRESFGTGKHSTIVGIIAIILVSLINLCLWIFIQPIDQNVVAAYDDVFPFNWVGAIIVTIFEALLLQITFIDIYEICSGVASKKELKKEGTSKVSSILGSLVIVIIGTLLILLCKYRYDIITEESFETRTLIFLEKHIALDEMVEFSYQEDYFLSAPITRIYYTNYHFYKLKLTHFKHLTDAAEEKYGEGNHMDMMDYIFLEKYAYINEQANQETN